MLQKPTISGRDKGGNRLCCFLLADISLHVEGECSHPGIACTMQWPRVGALEAWEAQSLHLGNSLMCQGKSGVHLCKQRNLGLSPFKKVHQRDPGVYLCSQGNAGFPYLQRHTPRFSRMHLCKREKPDKCPRGSNPVRKFPVYARLGSSSSRITCCLLSCSMNICFPNEAGKSQ